MDSHLLEQIPPLFGRKRGDQLLFSHRQDTFESNHKKVADQVSMNILGTAAHVILFKAADASTNGSLNFPLTLHMRLAVPEFQSLFLREPFTIPYDETWLTGASFPSGRSYQSVLKS